MALHIRHLVSFLVPLVFVLILLVVMHWFWALVISDSVSLFNWPFRNQFHDFMWAISSVSLINWPWSLLFFQSGFLFCLVIFCWLCYFLFSWWSPCCRNETFLSILYIVVKPCSCNLYTFLYADKTSAFFSFDVKPMYNAFGVMCLMQSQ